MESALVKHNVITTKLVHLFETRFSPEHIVQRDNKVKALNKAIFSALDQVTNLDEDKIIRQFVEVIMHTLRTNFYQKNSNLLSLFEILTEWGALLRDNLLNMAVSLH